MRLNVNGKRHLARVLCRRALSEAAVPHTDELLAGNSLASVEQLATLLEAMN